MDLDSETPQKIRIWSFPLDCAAELLPLAEGLLSTGECTRASRIQVDRHRRTFVVRRAMRRVLLAHLTAAKPSELEFIEVNHKKPRLVTPDSSIEFSSGHSGDCGVVVTGQVPLGVDIEALGSPLDYLGIAGRYFADEEYADIQRIPGCARRIAFFNCWTGKEAYVKALGVGLSKSLRSFAVQCAPGDPPGLRWDNETNTPRKEFRFLRYTDDEYVVTVVLTDTTDVIQPEFHALSTSSLRAFKPIENSTGPIWRPSP